MPFGARAFFLESLASPDDKYLQRLYVVEVISDVVDSYNSRVEGKVKFNVGGIGHWFEEHWHPANLEKTVLPLLRTYSLPQETVVLLKNWVHLVRSRAIIIQHELAVLGVRLLAFCDAAQMAVAESEAQT